MSCGVLLCVDDEAIILNALRDQLRKAYADKHFVEVAESAEEGLELLEQLTGEGMVPIVIVSDFLMPGMKGDAFLIEASRRFPRAVTVMLSGQVDQAAIERARVQGNLYQFFHKPWDSDALVRCINNGLAEMGPLLP